MAGILTPSNVGYEAKLYPIRYKMVEGSPTNLLNGDNTDMNRFGVGDYLEFEVKRMCNIYRCGNTQAKYGALKLSKWNSSTSAYVDVSATHNVAVTNINNTKWEKFIQNLPIGKYKLEYLSAERSDSEWYVERIKPEKCLIVSNGVVRTFNANNRWESITSLNPDTLTTMDFETYGFEYGLLNMALDKIYVGMVKSQTYETGEELWISDDIDSTMNISAMEYIDDTTKPRIQLTVPPFVPSDSLSPTDEILFYSTDPDFAPDIREFTLSSNTVHTESVKIDINPLYNFNENVKYRVKINDNPWSIWSNAASARSKYSLTILANLLKLGTNDIQVEISNEDGTKIGYHNSPAAITQTNAVPDILILNAHSDAFKVKFVISDTDATDTVEYRITINNDRYSEHELVPWTKLIENPGEVVYNIDTSYVSVDKTNVLSIYYRDPLGGSGKSSYTFTGSYKNILFVDENGEYYTSDKGAILKILHFGIICSGINSDPKKVKLKNSYSAPIDNLQLAINAITNNGTEFKISKTNNPFTGKTSLNYGTQVINNDDFIEFYVMACPSEEAIGLGEFEIVAQASIYAQDVK